MQFLVFVCLLFLLTSFLYVAHGIKNDFWRENFRDARGKLHYVQVYTRDTFYAEITVTTKKETFPHATSKSPCTSAIVRELCRGQDFLERGVLIYSVNDCMQYFLQYSQTCLFNGIRDCLRRYRRKDS